MLETRDKFIEHICESLYEHFIYLVFHDGEGCENCLYDVVIGATKALSVLIHNSEGYELIIKKLMHHLQDMENLKLH
ncbi:MAG TPA: hypothetical protein VHZ50_02760 [Puia sp.]|jgi:hypothetical protein|nr:hypothetical protein [Puia sp.]